MNLLDLFDAWAERRQRRWELARLDRAMRMASGHTWRDGLLAFGLDAKFLIALSVIGMFAWAYAENVNDDTMKGALIAGFAGAWGFYLGNAASTRHQERQQERATQDKAIDLAREAVAAMPAAPKVEPDVKLEPGQTAQAVDGDAKP